MKSGGSCPHNLISSSLLPLPIPLLFSYCNHVRSSVVPLCTAVEAGKFSIYLTWIETKFPVLQSFRKYSTEAPKKANLTPIYVGVGLAGLAAGLYRYSSSAVAEPKDRPKVFNGEDWVDLKLANIEVLSPNTKRLRFEYDDKEAVSGLPVACVYQFPYGDCQLITNVTSSCSLDPLQARGC